MVGYRGAAWVIAGLLLALGNGNVATAQTSPRSNSPFALPSNTSGPLRTLFKSFTTRNKPVNEAAAGIDSPQVMPQPSRNAPPRSAPPQSSAPRSYWPQATANKSVPAVEASLPSPDDLQRLATQACACHPTQKRAFLAALSHEMPDIRLEAVHAIIENSDVRCSQCNRALCRDELIAKTLADIAYGRNAAGGWLEEDESVRAAAREAIRTCHRQRTEGFTSGSSNAQRGSSAALRESTPSDPEPAATAPAPFRPLSRLRAGFDDDAPPTPTSPSPAKSAAVEEPAPQRPWQLGAPRTTNQPAGSTLRLRSLGEATPAPPPAPAKATNPTTSTTPRFNTSPTPTATPSFTLSPTPTPSPTSSRSSSQSLAPVVRDEEDAPPSPPSAVNREAIRELATPSVPAGSNVAPGATPSAGLALPAEPAIPTDPPIVQQTTEDGRPTSRRTRTPANLDALSEGVAVPRSNSPATTTPGVINNPAATMTAPALAPTNSSAPREPTAAPTPSLAPTPNPTAAPSLAPTPARPQGAESTSDEPKPLSPTPAGGPSLAPPQASTQQGAPAKGGDPTVAWVND